jgi:hypothetical protein
MYEIHDQKPNEVLMKPKLLMFGQVTNDERQHILGRSRGTSGGSLKPNRTIIQAWWQ